MAGNDIEIADAMSDAAEGGASIAWRLLATLEGGSLLLAATALLAYTASSGIARRTQRRPCKSVLITSTTSKLGGELKRRLELYGCTVSTVTSGATREASSGSSDDVDALVVIGAKPKGSGLNGISDLVTEDVYDNLKLLESLSSRVSRGGRIAWACVGAEEGEGASAVADKGEGASAGAGTGTGTFTSTAAAFDTVLQASLQHVAKVCNCEPIWVGRGDGAEQTAERVAAALMTSDTLPNTSGFSIRYAATKLGEYLYR